jgi:tetratricopeptide (TPR) repeat protein
MRSIGPLVLMLSTSLAGPAWSDWWADATVCSDPLARPDARINACASIIQSSETPAVNLSIAHYYRAFSHAAKGEFGFAIRDYDEALRRDPSLAEAYAGRGGAHQAQGAHDKAIQDLDEALRLDSTDTASYRRRGDS